MIIRDVPGGRLSLLEAVATLTRGLAERGYELVDDPQPRPGEALLLAYTPSARMNPFQALLYSRSSEYGVATLPIHHLEQLRDVPWRGPMACHLHWIGGV